jgi:acetyl esterase/lipase
MSYHKLMLITALVVSLLSPSAIAAPRTIHQVDPAYRAAVPYLSLNLTSEEDVRKEDKARLTAEDRAVRATVVTVDGLELRIYRPQQAVTGKLPIIYYSHGGGYLMRRAYYHFAAYQQMADRMQAAIVTPRYRTSMEAPFPAAVEDAYKGLQYIYKKSGQLGLDKERIIIMGNSAGGGLTAALALYNRDHEAIPLKGQILVYPMLDDRTGSKDDPYQSPNTGEILWNRGTNRFAWQKLRGGKAIPPDQMGYFSPIHAQRLDHLPPALVYAGDLDLFVNEDIAYANKLIENGVTTELHVIPGLYHGFDNAAPNAEKTKAFWQTVTHFATSLLSK